MKYVYLIALLIFSTPAYSQMTGPFIEGDNVTPYPSTIRCFSHKGFHDFLKSRDFRMIISSGGNEDSPIVKAVFTNNVDVIVANIIPDKRACVLDILENSAFSNEFSFKEKKVSPPAPQP